MTEIVVSKFGGTSVADFDAMNRSADIVLSDTNVRLVVLSASAGITNLLVALAEGMEPGERFATLDAIRKIQFDILDRLRHPNVIREEIERLLENITILAEAASLATSAALTDELVSHGELMSTLLFVEILRERDVQAHWFDVRKVMRTSDRFGRAEPDVAALAELAAQQLLPRLSETLVITQGFIGSESKGRTTTLGRGGSDYTAALLAEALHAARVDIWTDVPGIYTTDPRVVPVAQRIDEIDFEEAAEMATFGAKVLHPATLLPAVRSDIPVFVGSSKDPQAGGTLVCNKTQNPPLFRALALRRNQTLLTLHSLNMLHSRGFLAEVFGILARHNISVDLITTSEVSVALTLDTTGSTSTGDTLLTQSLLMELSALCRVEVEEGLALVALIGNNLSKACGVGKEVFGVLEPFNIRMICYGASSHNLCFLVPGDDAEKVVQKLHQNLLNNRPDTTAGERYQAIRCRMATQAPYPACRSSRRIALVAIRHTRYRLQHTPLVLFFRVDPLNDFIDPLQCQIVLFGQLRIITPIALAVNLIIPFRGSTRDTFGEINALPAPVAHHSVSNCLTGIFG